VKSELRKKEKQLEESREENLRLKTEAGRTRDGSPGFGGQSSRGDSPSSSGSGSETRESETRGGSDDEQARSLCAALAENASLKKFLRDYGMTWVGDGDARPAKEKTGEGEDAKPEVKRGKKVVSNRLKARAEAARLNKPTANAVRSGEHIQIGASGADAAALASDVPRDASTLAEPLKKHDDESKDRSDDPPAVKEKNHFAVDVEKLLASIASSTRWRATGRARWWWARAASGGSSRAAPRR
jgi:hypothetical protein